MVQAISLKICHLYPDLMDTYGDRGNIIAIEKRCIWRNIETTLTKISIGDKLNAGDFDIFFFGGGQDKAQIIVGKDLKTKKSALIKSIENDAVLLSICGGYQLLQEYFKTTDGTTINGIGLFDAHTIGSNVRMIQNLLIEIDLSLQSEIEKNYQTIQPALPAGRPSNHSTNYLVGFENHSGKTYLGQSVKSLGTVIVGAGNNGEDKTEGAIYKNAFGCYLHGSLLPKNPHFADYLISRALARRYGIVKLKPLDDSIEWQAHKAAIARTRSSY